MDWGESPLKGLRQIAIRMLDAAGAKSDPFYINAPDTLEIEEDSNVVDVPGGDKKYLSIGEVKGAKFKMKWADLNFTQIALLQGSLCVQQGTSGAANRSIRLKRKITDIFPYFELEGLVRYIGPTYTAGDYHVIAYLAQLTKAPKLNHKTSEVAAMEIEGYFFEREDGEFYDLLVNETYIAIPTTADNTAPTISNSPADAAASVAISANVVLTFSTEVQFEEDKFSLVETVAGTAVPYAITMDATNKIVTINPTSSLTALTSYTWAATDVFDMAGNAVTDTSTFTTA